jgi:hypothetical protein
MRKAAIAIAVLFLATGTAHAGMCNSYICGKVEVHHCLVKPSYNNGKFWSEQTTINIPLKEDKKGNFVDENVASGVFVYGPSNPTYYLNGKRYPCKDVSE